MKKEQIEFLKEFIKIFDKASFNLSGPEMVQMSLKIISFGKMVKDAENALNMPIAPIQEPVVITETKTRRSRKKESPIEVKE